MKQACICEDSVCIRRCAWGGKEEKQGEDKGSYIHMMGHPFL